MIDKRLFHFLNRLVLICLLGSLLSIAHAYNFSSGVFEFQQKLAKKGNPQAQYKLGNMYENGQGVNVNLNEASKWYTKAAAQNNAAAKMRLTYIDIKKNGYKKSKHQSWFKKLQKDAAAKDGESLLLLASLYKTGFIVRKNLKKSASLFKSASIRNVPGAEAELEAVNTLIYNEKHSKQQKAKAQKIKREQEQVKKDSAAKVREDKARKDRANKEKQLAQKRKKNAEQLKKQQITAQQREDERLRQEAEKQRLKQEQEKQRLAAEQAAQKEAEEKPAESKPLVKKDICKGKKARFLTMCR